ncbi:hypothetical protein L6164_012495 [Bauhinia variegata]|uniref:Uncharacterized protein n=1 Tax=Bauhinia variegata TaxID=167791 RepID=A0ACB9PBR3_BAUVA|nr:hypothetical protein L6164_012495 [Bauhinia variegata]
MGRDVLGKKLKWLGLRVLILEGAKINLIDRSRQTSPQCSSRLHQHQPPACAFVNLLEIQIPFLAALTHTAPSVLASHRNPPFLLSQEHYWIHPSKYFLSFLGIGFLSVFETRGRNKIEVQKDPSEKS